LRKWLIWLKDECKLKATKFMVDCSVAETEALDQSFRAHDVYYCSFHVGQAWERRMRLHHDVSKEVKTCADMRGPLNAIRSASSEVDLQVKWNTFQNLFPFATKLITYLEKQWMVPKKLAKWVLYFRENYQHTNTNNLVESWHKTLKRQHLGYERDLRADDLVCLLQGVVDVDFRTTHFKITHGLQPIVLSQYDKANKAKAMALAFDVASNMKYSISANVDSMLLFSCTCAEYIRHKVPCKHMYLVSRLYSGMEVCFNGDPTLAQELISCDID
ncbi:MAG: hypothetical protein JOS17DRAFT_670160, partial [Linnemannia elongata]